MARSHRSVKGVVWRIASEGEGPADMQVRSASPEPGSESVPAPWRANASAMSLRETKRREQAARGVRRNDIRNRITGAVGLEPTTSRLTVEKCSKIADMLISGQEANSSSS